MIIISELKLYDEKAAISHVNSLAFKRNAKFPQQETKAINYIQKELEKENIENKTESFTWAGTLTILLKLAFLFILCYVILYEIILLSPNFTWIILLLDVLLVVIIYFGVKILFDMTRITYLGKKRESKNIITKISANNKKLNRPLVIFSAHYDSVSTKYSYKLILSLYIIVGLLLIAYLILTFVLAIWSFLAILFMDFNDVFYWIRNISIIIGFGIITSIIIILFNKKKNESTGSIDNATGVAILIELSKLLNKNPLENIDVLLLWCGAEEFGLWGSKQFCGKHFDELNQEYNLDKSYNINIDMVGSYIGLVDKTGLIKKKKMNDNLNDVLDSVAKQQNIPLTKAVIPFGAGSDHMTFRAFAKNVEKDKFQVCCFSSNKDTKFIHSIKDTPEKCSTENLNGCIEICYNAVKSLDLRVE